MNLLTTSLKIEKRDNRPSSIKFKATVVFYDFEHNRHESKAFGATKKEAYARLMNNVMRKAANIVLTGRRKHNVQVN